MAGTVRVYLVGRDIFTGRQHVALHWSGSAKVGIPTTETVHMLVLASPCVLDVPRVMSLCCRWRSFTFYTAARHQRRRPTRGARQRRQDRHRPHGADFLSRLASGFWLLRPCVVLCEPMASVAQIVSNTLRECIKDEYEEVEEVSLCVIRCMGMQAVKDYVATNRNLRARPTE